MTEHRERKLFESWVVSEGGIEKKRLLGRAISVLQFVYEDRDVQLMWFSWLGRATLIAVLMQELRFG